MIIDEVCNMIKADDLFSADKMLNRYSTIIKDETNDEHLWRKKTFMLNCGTKFVSIMVRGVVIAVYKSIENT